MGVNIGISIMNIPPALDRLMYLYQVSYTSMAVLLSALFWSHTFFQIPGGIIVDRLGIRKTLVASLILMCLGDFLPAMFSKLEVAILGRLITGVGTGLGFVGTMKLLAVSVPARREGTYQALFGGFFSFGCIIPYLVIPFLIEYGWWLSYLMPAVFCLPLLAIIPKSELIPVNSFANEPMLFGAIIRNPQGWILGVYHALSYGSMMNLGNWVPSLLAEAEADLTSVEFAWGGMLVMLVSGLGRILGGVSLLKFSALIVTRGSILVLAIIFLGFSLVATLASKVIMAVAAAWFASINFGALFQLATRATTTNSLGTLIGFINLLGNVGFISFTFLFGFTKDKFDALSWSFPILSFLCLAAFLLGYIPLQKLCTIEK
jgi:MFS family permease